MKGGAFEIAGRKIGGGRTFVIAEAGTNHDGSLDKAREMVRIAADCPLICPTVVDATIAGPFRERARLHDERRAGDVSATRRFRGFRRSGCASIRGRISRS